MSITKISLHSSVSNRICESKSMLLRVQHRKLHSFFTFEKRNSGPTEALHFLLYENVNTSGA